MSLHPGLTWSYNSTLNHKISPLYQAICEFDVNPRLSCAEDSSYFEPLLIEFLAHFTSLMELYQAEEEEK